ncbi:MAG TPA: ADP-glyceromanno-heptose 6-epimerase [Candidatus Methylacidiphilales bacterium]|jgi:ADP-L-glycero-D-manno-heptose 6-epimerase|nr:ADP-glyceromanno-heptose 6-epimerase [Candidatus Methylacidiphilales bacterium]
MYKHIVVTGGAGFVGSNLVHELARRYPETDLTVVDDFRSGHFKNLDGFKGDLIASDLAQMEMKRYFGGRKVDLVFHLASITDTTDHDQLRQVRDNVESWRNLLNYFEGRKTRLVYASSAATYGIAAGVNKVDQEPKPANVYAFSKVQLDNLARRWARENPSQVVVGLRYFNVYGPREAHKGAASSMILQLAQQIRRGQPPRIFKHGEQVRDFVYVKDIVTCTILAARARSFGIYNAGSGVPRSFNDIVANLNRVLNTQWQPEYIDNPHAHYQPHTEADLTQTARALRYTPKFTLEKGIDDYAASGFLV